jgi:hypothetical protein
MNLYSEYLPDGRFTGHVHSDPCPVEGLWRVGSFDSRKVKIDITTGNIVPFKPEAPQSNEYQMWEWNEGLWEWVPKPTELALASQVRTERDHRISAFEWRYRRYEREVRLGLRTTDVLAVLDNYAQALADITKQKGFPYIIEWPVEPE